jgi:hypothetical protein
MLPVFFAARSPGRFVLVRFEWKKRGKCCPFFCGAFPGPFCASAFDRKKRGNAARFFAARSPGRFVLVIFDRKTMGIAVRVFATCRYPVDTQWEPKASRKCGPRPPILDRGAPGPGRPPKSFEELGSEGPDPRKGCTRLRPTPEMLRGNGVRSPRSLLGVGRVLGGPKNPSRNRGPSGPIPVRVEPCPQSTRKSFEKLGSEWADPRQG